MDEKEMGEKERIKCAVRRRSILNFIIFWAFAALIGWFWFKG